MEQDRLKSERIPRLLFSLALPAICAQIITLLYNLVDRIYIGRMEDGLLAMGASVSSLVLTSFIITAVVLAAKRPILKLFGASEAILPYTDGYMSVYCLGTVFVQLTVGMNYYISTQGFARTAMVTTMLGGLLNIALAPLFIFALGLGIRGAAMATVLSQFASFVWAAWFMLGRRACSASELPI